MGPIRSLTWTYKNPVRQTKYDYALFQIREQRPRDYRKRPKHTQIITELIRESRSSSSGTSALSNVLCFSIIMAFFLKQGEKNKVPIESRNINKMPKRSQVEYIYMQNMSFPQRNKVSLIIH